MGRSCALHVVLGPAADPVSYTPHFAKKEIARPVPDRNQVTPIIRTKLYRPPEPEDVDCVLTVLRVRVYS